MFHIYFFLLGEGIGPMPFLCAILKRLLSITNNHMIAGYHDYDHHCLLLLFYSNTYINSSSTMQKLDLDHKFKKKCLKYFICYASLF
jgi:hypothetical protein